ncbi:hypothetical protein CTI12_AA107380 [Artemisia annua]|uniref:NLGase n=1 Tax=Artemisia annua TaxID=35608 RepID=A0A2U1PVP4_ARTAN|nr:hypothetical protein CTI12_AA107380 [Artemisia annua]
MGKKKNIFHYRKNSWPPEEFVNRNTLQLLDFDSGAPPEHAWRRKLNSHAGILKEFSVTFMEALKMIRLGIRLWSYVREEASHGRKAPIDPFNRDGKPSATHGVPLGGMGSGSITRGFRGEFRQFQIIPGACENAPMMANQFSIFIKRDNGNKKYASVLSPGQHDGTGRDQGLSSWGWNLNGHNSTYHALFPRAWTVYDGEPDPELKVSCRQISPFLPHNYRDSSLPTTVFVYTLVNTGKERAQVSLLFTWANSIGGTSHFTGDHVNEPFMGEDGVSGDANCAALSASTWVEPNGKCTVAFALAWSSPKVKFMKGKSYHRRYTKYYGTFERAAKDLVHDALTNYKKWEEDIEKWQNPILNDDNLPEWYKFTLFNELYFLVAGGTIWIDTPVPADDSGSDRHLPRIKNKKTDVPNGIENNDSTHETGSSLTNSSEDDTDVPEKDDKRNSTDLFTKSHDIEEDVGHFLYLEGVEYIMWCTYDVHFYASFALLELFPKIELSIQREFAKAVLTEDTRKVKFLAEGNSGIRKVKGAVPHDLGTHDPWHEMNAYNIHDTSRWKDLNPKFVLQVYRDFAATGDLSFGTDTWPAVCAAMEYMDQFDRDRDSLIENDDTPVPADDSGSDRHLPRIKNKKTDVPNGIENNDSTHETGSSLTNSSEDDTDVPEKDDKRNSTDLFTKSHDIEEDVGHFLYLEGVEYIMWCTYDVHFYASFALLELFPKIELSIQREFAKAVLTEDTRKVKFLAEGNSGIRKVKGAVPHDLGTHDPWHEMNAYNIHDTSRWKDLNPKFVLQVYRDFAATGDLSFGTDTWPAVCAAMEYMDQFDRDRDSLIENDGFPDQTYDAWTVHGISAYCGCLWLAALQATAAMAVQLDDNVSAQKYKKKFLKAKTAFESKLWNGTYFNYDSGSSSTSKSIQADQLAGQWYTASSGLPNLFDDNKIQSSLQKIYDFNVMKVRGGRMGAVNGMHPNGKVDETCMQSREVWTGVTYGVAATMIHAGMEDEAFKTAEGIFTAGWSEDGFGYAFQTPEGWTMDGSFRSLVYMRPLAIWGMQRALTAPNGGFGAPGMNVLDRINTPPLSSRTSFNDRRVKRIAHKAKCFTSSLFRCAC